ncbi:TIGR03617 family F420-dependent LLM class oxidoreductase [Aquabacter spiritensis]|uniref:Putative F420-dependent oxidoreductase n=1 Tax=Aquabacter spiritensis TaxID=933073 RepID=A0A4V2UXV7_9HYPH|nr:TIGR03617 family F420-dependent LLM class oxidoreductase [Aquabacter spiritensis]TCT04998.1 putative F420-dependent oxidoreductase [Aquabacter spiritensis]
MRVITQLPNNNLKDAQKVAQMAERAGFDGCVALENAHNPYIPLAAAALVTERIQLGTAVAMAFPRAPTITAHGAWDVHNASDGRFYLGLGAQVKAHNERRYGLPWSPPAPRMRDYIGAVRAVWNTWAHEEPLDYHSENYTLTLMTPNFSPKPNGLPRIPVSIATVGPAMLRLAGEICDGVRLHPFSSRNYLEQVSVAGIKEGLARGGRDRRNIEVVCGGFIATGRDAAAVAKMRDYVRFRIAFYCSTRAYWDVLRMHDLVELGEKVNPYPRENRWDEMAALIPDEAFDLFAIAGDYQQLPKLIEQRYGGLGDTVSLNFQPDDDVDQLAEMVAEIHRIPCAFEDYAAEAPKARAAA